MNQAKQIAEKAKDKLYEKAKENENQIIAEKKVVARGFMNLAKLLYDNTKNKYYEYLGSESFEEYIATPEISISRSVAYDLIKAYEVFILKLKMTFEDLATVEITKVRQLLRIDIKNKEEAIEWLSKSTSLSRSDLQTEIDTHRGIAPEHKKRTQCEEAWYVLKLRLAGRQIDLKDGWLVSRVQEDKIKCLKCGTKQDTIEDVILDGHQYKITVAKCPKCHQERIVIVI